VMKKMQKSFFSKLFGNRKGTAEIVGSVLFLVILLFVFTNVYLWHDNASREMNGVLAEKLNTPVSISAFTGGLNVTNNGGFEVGLSRLWLQNVTNTGEMDHMYVDLEHNDFEELNVYIVAGDEIQLYFVGENVVLNSDGSIRAEIDENGDILVWYPIPDHYVRCKILTTLGNMRACTYDPTY